MSELDWTEIHIPLPYKKPPLTANQRLHWRQRAQLTRKVRGDMRFLLRSVRYRRDPLAQGERIVVALNYTPPDNRRRDEDNLVPTLKALCDGIVDAGIVCDDTPQYMAKCMPKIWPASKSVKYPLVLTLKVTKG